MPRYMAKPKAADVAITADTLPISPSHGLDRTTSPIMQVTTLLVKSETSYEIINKKIVKIASSQMATLLLQKCRSSLPECYHQDESRAKVRNNCSRISL